MKVLQRAEAEGTFSAILVTLWRSFLFATVQYARILSMVEREEDTRLVLLS